ncbi:MAG: hypothetical protein Q8K93_16925 [Reyranella sp.]|nr:hypothetical protein [Reyranella sp.]
MPETTDIAEQLRVMRDLARRARRLAQSVSNADRDRLLKHADELERQASELEHQATAAPPGVQVQMQVQQQQQQETGPPAAEPEDDKPKG